jgi:uncharacterized protein
MDLNRPDARVIFDYVIFHKYCLDGFSGFIILTTTNTIDRNALIYPDVPSAKEPPPNLHGKNVIVIDVAYKKEIIEQMFNEAKFVLFIDHHISIRNDILQLVALNANRHRVVYDSSKSGASLTWRYFYPKKKLPLFIKYIEDNDTGTWKYKHTMPFILGLQVNFKLDLSRETITKWKKLFNTDTVKNVINLGRKYSEYEEYLLDINSKKYSVELFPSQQIYDEFRDKFQKPGQYRVCVLNTSCPNGSLLGKKVLDEVDCDFCMMWSLHLDKKEIVASLRSKNVDVGELAKVFGGGGHRLASAFSFPLTKYNITDLFYPTSLPRASIAK